MRVLALLFATCLPASTLAWEGEAGFAISARTTIGEITSLNNTTAITLNGESVDMGCRIALNLPPERPEGEAPVAYHLIINSHLLPLVLFYKAHNTPIQVAISLNNRRCQVERIRTCFDAATCAGPFRL